MQYLAWRVLTQKNLSIKFSFLPVGHTKFAPDSCFGLFKQHFRRTSVGSLEDIAAVMNDSLVVNFAQLVGTSEGEILVQSYDWTGFFSKMFRKIDGIKQYHHFSSEEEVLREGELIVQKTCSDVPSGIKFLKDAQCVFTPEVVQSRSLTAERQCYLYEKVREFCPGASKDKTCPLPSVPKPSSACNTPVPQPNMPQIDDGASVEVLPPTKEEECAVNAVNLATTAELARNRPFFSVSVIWVNTALLVWPLCLITLTNTHSLSLQVHLKMYNYTMASFISHIQVKMSLWDCISYPGSVFHSVSSFMTFSFLFPDSTHISQATVGTPPQSWISVTCHSA